MELNVITQSDASKDKPSHHIGEIPICRNDDEKRGFNRKRQDEPAVYSYRLRQGPQRRLGKLTRRSDQKILKFRATRLAHALPVRHLESKQRFGNEYDGKVAQGMTLFWVSWHDILFNTAFGFVELGTE